MDLDSMGGPWFNSDPMGVFGIEVCGWTPTLWGALG